MNDSIIQFRVPFVSGVTGGDKEALAGARASIWNALIGLFLVIAAFSIAKIIESVFGIRIVSGVNLPGQ
ncbi:hypothetical protein HYW39_00830 [Candidatus Curtissbacteria bacterium]|nr:hypothetical protein [Candidatus Curtissbacteria bacterium]